MHTNVLMLFGQPVDSSGATRIHPAAKQINLLVAAAGTAEIAAYMHQLSRLATGLFEGFAPRNVIGAFALVDDARYQFQKPRGSVVGRRLRQRPDTKLLNQDHAIQLGVVQQHARRMAALKHLPLELRAPATGEQTMTQAQLLDTEKAFEDLTAVEDGDVLNIRFNV